MRHLCPLDVPKARISVTAQKPNDMLRDGDVKQCGQTMLPTSDLGGGWRRSKMCMGAVGKGGSLALL